MSIYKIPEKTNIEVTAQRTDIAHFMDVIIRRACGAKSRK